MPKEVKKFTYSISGIETSFLYKDDRGVILLFEDHGGKWVETKIHNKLCMFNVEHIPEDYLERFVVAWARQCKENLDYGMRIARSEVNDCIDKLFNSLKRRT